MELAKLKENLSNEISCEMNTNDAKEVLINSTKELKKVATDKHQKLTK